MHRPNSRRNLDLALERAFGRGGGYLSARTVMADAIVAAMLPDGAVKGGSSLKLRYGDEATRFTEDLDAARASDLESYLDRLEDRLESGWEGFTGHVVPRDPASPDGVPTAYVMQPFDVKLDYNGKPWVTVRLEVGHDEIGDADSPEAADASIVSGLFFTVGLPVPPAAPLMPLDHQIAQKLHGLSESGGKRTNDLIDLQIIAERGELDLSRVRRTCVRLFSYRRAQAWPPRIVEGEGWRELYDAQGHPKGVLSNVGAAVRWVNDFVRRIDEAR